MSTVKQKTDLEKYTFLARVAEQAENYKDMANFLKQIIATRQAMTEDFNIEERNLLSVGFKNYIGELQMQTRVAYAIDRTPKYRKYGDALP